MAIDAELIHLSKLSFGCRKFVSVKVSGTYMKRRALYDEVRFHSVLFLICVFEVRNYKLWEILDDLVKVIN